MTVDRWTQPTQRQFATLAAVVRHGSYKEAAADLGLATGTIKNHLRELHARTDMTTVQLVYRYRTELALYFATRGSLA